MLSGDYKSHKLFLFGGKACGFFVIYRESFSNFREEE